MSILLIRHGETALNVARTVQPPDTPLSPRGLAQAEALARRMATLGLAAIVSSDLPRAWRTAEALAVTTGLRVEPSALLHERNFGDLRGRPYDSMGFDPLHMVDAPPNGESAEAFRQRVTDAFAMLVRLRATLAGPLAAVTHGLVIRELLLGHAALPTGMTVPARIGNTSVTVFAATQPHEVALLDCTRHLGAALGDNEQSLSGG